MQCRILWWGSGTNLFRPLVKLTRLSLIVSFMCGLFATSANAAPLVYVVNAAQQLGALILPPVRSSPSAAPAPEPLSNLVWGSDGSLFTLFAASGSLATINPSTGEFNVIGPTGLGSDAFDLAGVGGNLYLTDFQNNFYSVDPGTGAARLIGATGMPPDPTIPFTTNADGTFNLCDESLYGVDGKLYATFHSFDFDPKHRQDFLAVKTKVDPKLYWIPATGIATLIGPTDVQLGSSVKVDTRFYAFRLVLTNFIGKFPRAYSELVTLDLTGGKVSYVRTIDPAAGPIFGAVPVQH